MVAGSIVVTTANLGSNVTKYSSVWTSDASGNVNGNTFNSKMGTFIAVEFIPGSGGSQPTDLYDVDCLGAGGVSVFDNGAGASIGANLSNAVSSHHVPLVGLAGVTIYRRWNSAGPLELTVASAGNAKSGTVNIFMVDGII